MSPGNTLQSTALVHERGGAGAHVNLDEVPEVGTGRAGELVLDDALNALAGMDSRKAPATQ